MSDFGDKISGEDFSVSEDEWKPNKKDGDKSSDTENDFEDSALEFQSDKLQTQKKGSARKSTSQFDSLPAKKIKASKAKKSSLRVKMYNKYKPPPKTMPKNVSPLLNEALKSSEYRKRKGLTSSCSDSSGSSVNDHLVNPKDINLTPVLFEKSEGQTLKTEPPNFDCNIGLTLSDSECDNGGHNDEKNMSITGMTLKNAEENNQNNEVTTKYTFDNIKVMQEFEKAKEKLKLKNNSKESIKKEMMINENQGNSSTTDDISKLLAMGEKMSSIKSNVLKKSLLIPAESNKKNTNEIHLKNEGETDSDADWEEVKDNDQHINKNLIQNLNDTIQVTVDIPQYGNRNNKKSADEIEASLKRRINRVIKENQLVLHKVSLLCHISHGIYCNTILNNPVLMSQTLKLLPNKNCYPNGRTEIKYFESMIKWYKTAIKLKYDGMYCNFCKRPKLLISLALQIKYKSAICKKDYVLIFIILLRAMGIQCRLVMNLVTLPIRPSQNDLCSLKQKKSENTTSKKKSNINKNIKKKINKKSKSSNEDESSCDFSDDNYDEDIDDDNNENQRNKMKPITRKKNIEKNENTTKKQQSSVSKGHEYTTEQIKCSTDKSSKCSIKNTNNKTRKINLDKLKISIEKDTKTKKIHLDKLKSSPKKTTEISNEITKQKNEIDQKIKSNNTKSTSKGTKLEIDQLASSSNVNNKNNKNKVIINLEQNIRITRSKSRSPLLLEDNCVLEKDSEKISCSEDNNIEKNKNVTRSKSPLPDEGSAGASKSRSKSKSRKEVEATEVQNQKESNIIMNLQQNVRITRSKRRSPLLLEGNEDNEDNKREKNKRLKKNKSPLPDEGSASASKSRSKSKSKKEVEAMEVQYQKESSDEPMTSVTSKTRKLTVQNVNRQQTRGKIQTKNDENEENVVIPQLDGADDSIDIKKKSKRSSSSNNRKIINNGKKDNERRKVNLKKLQVPDERKNSLEKSDDEFVPPKKLHKSNKSQSGLFSGEKVIDRRVLSTDEEDNNYDDSNNKTKHDDEKQKNKKNMDFWIEVFSETEDQWITIDLFKGKVHCVDSIRKSATSPIAYVFAWNNDNTLKDVSPRYCPQWNTTTRKLRVDQEWLDEAIENYLGKKTSRDIAEDRELQKIHLDKPLPTTISEYKNHPLYVLKRHLLKFEVIYPPDALTLGFVRGEPVYSRSCVHVCHSRDIWLKSARVIKLGEQPYKIVKSRPKWDRMSQTVVKDQPLEIFGYWQTKQYDPPTAENGIVPRNAYGNVELFKKCMLPKKTVHLQLPGLNRICKKLNIDCAPAVIGFDFHQGVCHPLLDGFVICEEFKDIVIEAWQKDKEEAARKEKEKYLQRVYGNWKKLIKGMLIKQKLKIKYNF